MFVRAFGLLTGGYPGFYGGPGPRGRLLGNDDSRVTGNPELMPPVRTLNDTIPKSSWGKADMQTSKFALSADDGWTVRKGVLHLLALMKGVGPHS